MTEPNDPLDPNDHAAGDPDDDVLSAVLDGLASPIDVDAVAGDPARAARLAQFRAVRDAIEAPIPALPDEDLSALVDTALTHIGDPEPIDTTAVEDVDDDQVDPVGTGAELRDWTDHRGPGRPADQIAARRKRARRSSRVHPLLVAAVLLVIAGGGLFVALNARSHNADHAALSPTTGSSSFNAAASPDNAKSVPEAAAGTDASAVTFLGSYPDQASLTTALTTLDPSTLRPTALATTPSTPASPTAGAAGTSASYVPTTGDINRCDNVVRLSLRRAITNRLAVAGAILGGKDVLVESYDAPATATAAAGIVIVVADRQNCFPLLQQNH